MHNCILYKNEVTSFSPQNVPYSSSHYVNFRLYPHPLILAVHYLYFYPLFSFLIITFPSFPALYLSSFTSLFHQYSGRVYTSPKSVYSGEVSPGTCVAPVFSRKSSSGRATIPPHPAQLGSQKFAPNCVLPFLRKTKEKHFLSPSVISLRT